MKHKWTAAEEALLVEHYPGTKTSVLAEQMGMSVRQIYQKAMALGLKKTDAYLASPDACRLRRGEHIGKGTQFKPGHSTWNKGIHFDSGGRSHETRFQKGSKPHTWHPVGHERESKEGYLQRKLTDTGVTRRDYVAVHHIAWKEAGREIPKGHALVFKDGNKRNFALENLELVSRAELMARNSYHNNYPKEVAQLIQLRGAISRQINKRQGKNHGQ